MRIAVILLTVGAGSGAELTVKYQRLCDGFLKYLSAALMLNPERGVWLCHGCSARVQSSTLDPACSGAELWVILCRLRQVGFFQQDSDFNPEGRQSSMCYVSLASNEKSLPAMVAKAKHCRLAKLSSSHCTAEVCGHFLSAFQPAILLVAALNEPSCERILPPLRSKMAECIVVPNGLHLE